jgi:hypothetical protein
MEMDKSHFCLRPLKLIFLDLQDGKLSKFCANPPARKTLKADLSTDTTMLFLDGWTIPYKTFYML